MRYRNMEFDLPIQTLSDILETYFRSISVINDDEDRRTIEYGHLEWDTAQTLKIKLVLEKIKKGGVTITKF